MLKCEEPGTVTRGIAAHAPVEGAGALRVWNNLHPPEHAHYQRRLSSCQSLALPVRLIIARLPLAYMPKLLV
jgi:hypothetical protein